MYDIVVNNGLLVDPELMTQTIGSIGIKDGKISVISSEPLMGAQIIDASGLVVCPGFIDPHTHIDGQSCCAELSLHQGVTTAVGGNCGLSPICLSAFFEEQDRNGFVINQAEFIGHSFSMRKAVGLQDVYAPATPKQVDQMVYLAERGLEQGACGVSFGLDYAPGSSHEEVLALSKTAAKYNRTIAIHTGMKDSKDLDSLIEVIGIGRVTGARILVSHFVYQYGEGIMDEALELVDRAISSGVDLFIDSGMYTPWATSIGTATYDEKNIAANSWRFGDMLVATGKYNGRRLDRETYDELRSNSPDECVIYFTGEEQDIYKALRKSYAMPSSDTAFYEKGEGHPQIAGTFPRYIQKMVRERKDLSLTEAIRKVTLLPAQTIGLTHKGRLSVNSDADLVAFDLDTITDNAEFSDHGSPDALPEGIEHVLVDGVEVLTHGKYNKLKCGKSIRF